VRRNGPGRTAYLRDLLLGTSRPPLLAAMRTVLLHGRNYRSWVRRLEQEVAGAPLLGARHLDEVTGYDDHRNTGKVRVRSHPVVECPSVDAGHAEIQNRDARAKALPEVSKCILGAPRRSDFKAVGAQQHGEGLPGVVIVVDDDDVVRRMSEGGTEHRHVGEARNASKRSQFVPGGAKRSPSPSPDGGLRVGGAAVFRG